MQDAASGGFVHILQYPTLRVKQPFRIIYYDGEAAFGLMRLYGLTKDPRWLAVATRAVRHFIAAGHAAAHSAIAPMNLPAIAPKKHGSALAWTMSGTIWILSNIGSRPSRRCWN